MGGSLSLAGPGKASTLCPCENVTQQHNIAVGHNFESVWLYKRSTPPPLSAASESVQGCCFAVSYFRINSFVLTNCVGDHGARLIEMQISVACAVATLLCWFSNPALGTLQANPNIVRGLFSVCSHAWQFVTAGGDLRDALSHQEEGELSWYQ